SPSGSFGSIAWGVNDMDQMVGYYQDASSAFTYHSFLTNGLGDAITFINFNDPLGPTDTEARGINNAGQIVGFYYTLQSEHAFLLSGGTYTNIDNPFYLGQPIFPHAINNGGVIVGSFGFSGGTGGFVDIPDPGGGGSTSFILDINSSQISANGIN